MPSSTLRVAGPVDHCNTILGRDESVLVESSVGAGQCELFENSHECSLSMESPCHLEPPR